MAQPDDVHTFEFADVSSPSASPQPDEPRPPRRFAVIASMAGVLLSLLLLLGVVSSGGVDAPAVADDENPSSTDATREPTTSTTSTTAVPTSDRTNETVTGGEFVPWPNPPEDRSPIVIGRPGPDRPVFGESSDLTIVYVNGLGRPTVIDLDTGRVEQVDVAPIRSYDFFGVEFGSVVSFDGQNRNVNEATDRALLFHTHRAGQRIPTSDIRSNQNPSPHLCLSPEPCTNETWTFENVTNGTDTIRRANATDDPEVIEMLFGDSWTVDNLNRSSPTSFGFDLRVPTPLNDEVWIVHQPRSG